MTDYEAAGCPRVACDGYHCCVAAAPLPVPLPSPPLPSPPPPPHPPAPPPPPPSPPPPSPIATAANGTHGIGSRRLHERDVFGGGTTSDDFGGRCQPCPAGYLSVSPGSASCEPCPRGTASAALGLAGWDGCALCPQGTSSAVLGASSCTPCEVPYASPHTVCPAGSISPGSAADWPRLHAQRSFLSSLRSADFPEVS